ncbi:membrane protein insertion efficiency factor YidD [Moraxella oblonga]|uniref:membrane protein insertion efficiency factor YidD n=1 Tax=Moraxella oblonga TaxID=200413 RepID=UPI000A47F7C9|nr:membrane protein insertion efficiency factor YidD [Moraxella oblonga]
MRKFLLFLIKIYQKIISPTLPARCRYYPTCSAYARTALLTHRLPTALRLIAMRLARCQPFGGHGVDFVPVPMYRYHFVPTKWSHSCVFVDNFSYQKRQNKLANC